MSLVDSQRAQLPVVVEAGGVLRRPTPGGFELCIVRRRKRGDTVLPKGHREDGESLEQTAIREVREETGYPARITVKPGNSR